MTVTARRVHDLVSRLGLRQAPPSLLGDWHHSRAPAELLRQAAVVLSEATDWTLSKRLLSHDPHDASR